MSDVSSARLHFTITFSRLNRSVNGGARSKSLDHPQHHRRMLKCPLQARTPGNAAESWRALSLHQILERRVSPRVVRTSRIPRPNRPPVGAIHVMRGMWGGWHDAMVGFPVCSWRRQMAVRHLLPFPSLSLNEGPRRLFWEGGGVVGTTGGGYSAPPPWPKQR